MGNPVVARFMIFASCLALAGTLPAKSYTTGHSGQALYIVLLDQPSLAEWYSLGGMAPDSILQSATGKRINKVGNRGRLDVQAASSRAYVHQLDKHYEQLLKQATIRLGRDLKPVYQYRNALNGFAENMTAEEAALVAVIPGVKMVRRDEIHKLESDAGPAWIGADDIWGGVSGLPEVHGEGVIVGVIDSGINWKHDAFKDLGDGGGSVAHDHQNPLGPGVYLGLCDLEEVLCNDKLIGVYDFVTDLESTELVEQSNNGFDYDGHGSHVASIAVGNSSTILFSFGSTTLSGVAPNANLISYRVCYIGDPDDPIDDGCSTAAIAAAIDQAIADGVDVINYSIGSTAFSPWEEGTATQAFLNAFGAGIFVATSTGNSGPQPSTIGAPANAPWISAVANATHDRVFGTEVKDLGGGDMDPPGTLVGASWVGDSGIRNIVHAKDYGYDLCGDVTETATSVSCTSTSSDSNPFPPGTFNGEIVVCDRGVYGRIEKGLNLKLAGAGGYILANTEERGASISADEHCLPASHLTRDDGDKLRVWLDSGSGHQGQITGSMARRNNGAADVIASSSSRGPADSPVQDVLKPNLLAPGSSILGAFAADEDDDTPYALLSGTSMASPHVAGAAALLLSVNPDWVPSILNSAIETTATLELASNSDGSSASPFDGGSGRPRLGEAAKVGLYLEETLIGFKAANPELGGNPGALNLSGLVESDCRNVCNFTRTVTSRTAKKTWVASSLGFPEGVTVTVAPSEFELAGGGNQVLDIEVALAAGDLVGNWVYGKVLLSAIDEPDQALTIAVYASAGDVPSQWSISSSANSGEKTFLLSNLTALPNATFTAAGLVREQRRTEAMPEDLTREDPFDAPTGTFTVLQDVPEGSLWLHSRTLESTSLDLDLYVGIDSNRDGRAQENEQLCSSTATQDLEVCDIYAPEPGRYWIMVQNWHASNDAPDDVTLVYALVGDYGELGLTATGPGITDTNETFPVSVAWNNVNAVTGEALLGAVAVGTNRDYPQNVGIIPVRFSRTSIAVAETLALMDGREQRFALRGGDSHDRAFIDVPPGADSLAVSASGINAEQNDRLTISLKRVDYDIAFDSAPGVLPAPGGSSVASASGANGLGPQLNLSGGALAPGRWYVVLTNDGIDKVSVRVQADVTFSAPPSAFDAGLWQPGTRPGISQGVDYAQAGGNRAMLWYTYDEQGLPTWYLAAGPEPEGNIWTVDLLRFTNDGKNQKAVLVGQLSLTTLAEEDLIFTWQLFGVSGSDRLVPTSLQTCPEIGNAKQSYTGIWFRGTDGLGGASVLVNSSTQGQVHYLYDSVGVPRWLLASSDEVVLPTDREIPMKQFSGFCPTCVGEVSSTEVGLLTRDFTSETTGSWTLNYVLKAPLLGDVNRTENTFKLSNTLACD